VKIPGPVFLKLLGISFVPYFVSLSIVLSLLSANNLRLIELGSIMEDSFFDSGVELGKSEADEALA